MTGAGRGRTLPVALLLVVVVLLLPLLAFRMRGSTDGPVTGGTLVSISSSLLHLENAFRSMRYFRLVWLEDEKN